MIHLYKNCSPEVHIFKQWPLIGGDAWGSYGTFNTRHLASRSRSLGWALECMKLSSHLVHCFLTVKMCSLSFRLQPPAALPLLPVWILSTVTYKLKWTPPSRSCFWSCCVLREVATIASIFGSLHVLNHPFKDPVTQHRRSLSRWGRRHHSVQSGGTWKSHKTITEVLGGRHCALKQADGSWKGLAVHRLSQVKAGGHTKWCPVKGKVGLCLCASLYFL